MQVDVEPYVQLSEVLEVMAGANNDGRVVLDALRRSMGLKDLLTEAAMAGTVDQLRLFMVRLCVLKAFGDVSEYGYHTPLGQALAAVYGLKKR